MAARGETSTGRDSQCHMYKRLRRTTIRKPVLQMAAKSTPHIQQCVPVPSRLSTNPSMPRCLLIPCGRFPQAVVCRVWRGVG